MWNKFHIVALNIYFHVINPEHNLTDVGLTMIKVTQTLPPYADDVSVFNSNGQSHQLVLGPFCKNSALAVWCL